MYASLQCQAKYRGGYKFASSPFPPGKETVSLELLNLIAPIKARLNTLRTVRDIQNIIYVMSNMGKHFFKALHK